MSIDWSISVGNLIQLVTLIVGALSVFMGLSYRIKGVEKEILELSGVVVTLAVQKTEIEHLRKRVDDLAEGKGYNLDSYPKILKRHQI
jgi:hypothetical protein